MDVSIPTFLHHHLLQYGFGAAGTLWLADLPRHIAELEQAWGMRAGPAFDQDGAVSWVAPVELRDGSEAVLPAYGVMFCGPRNHESLPYTSPQSARLRSHARRMGCDHAQ